MFVMNQKYTYMFFFKQLKITFLQDVNGQFISAQIIKKICCNYFFTEMFRHGTDAVIGKSALFCENGYVLWMVQVNKINMIIN